MSKPLLTVCLLTYNQAPYVRQAIDSILEQRVKDSWELVIADDCSTDGTQKILEEYGKKHPDRIKLMLRNKNVGPEENWLTLMSVPTSKYVVYAEGDDYFTDIDKLQEQIDFLEANKDFAVCFHPVKIVYEDGTRADEVFPRPEQLPNQKVLSMKHILENNFIQTNSAMYRWRYNKGDIKAIFPKDISPGDWFLHILHAEVGKIGVINKVMSVYRKHPGGLWWSAHNNRDEFWKRYGIMWLRFYVELLKMYGKVPEYRRIIESSIINLLNSLKEVDSRKHEGLQAAAMAALPESINIYLDNLWQQISGLKTHSDKQAKLISHYVDKSTNLEGELNRMRGEHSEMASRAIVRLENKLKSRLKRSKK